MLFTPTSSLAQPSFLKGAMNTSNEVENFLSTIEQSQSLRITSGQVGKQSILKASSKTNVSTLVLFFIIQGTLDRLREMRRENVEFSKKVDQFSLDQEREIAQEQEKKSAKNEPPSVHDLDVIVCAYPQVPFNVQRTSFGSAPVTNTNPFDFLSRNSRTTRNRILSGPQEIDKLHRASRSHSEDDDLLFNMSELDL
jgi:hypothetical protein